MNLPASIVSALFNKSLFSNIRFYVLCITFVIALSVHLYVETFIDSGSQAIIETQSYAFLAVGYLYFALLVGPLSRITRFPYVDLYLKARRSLGVSAFFFALLHTYNAFFDYIGGWQAYLQLPLNYHIATALSFTALLILSLMAATSFDFIIKKLTFRKWKRLHQMIYIGGIFIVIHTALIGQHISAFGSIISDIFFLGVTLLVSLHAYLHLKKN